MTKRAPKKLSAADAQACRPTPEPVGTVGGIPVAVDPAVPAGSGPVPVPEQPAAPSPVASPGPSWEITGSTADGQQFVIADAKSRSWRTLITGLLIDVVAALIAAVGQIAGIDPGVGRSAWVVVAVLVGKSVIQAALSFIARLSITPTMKVGGDKYVTAPVSALPPKESP